MDERLLKFLQSDTRTRLALADDSANEPALRNYLGDEALAELQALAARVPSGDHLAVDGPTNMVFLPGVMGSLLTSNTLGGVWWIDLRSLGHLRDLRLGRDGTTDADPTHDIRPFAVDTSYEAFRSAVVATDDLVHEAFHYDWRKPLTASASRLRDLLVQLTEDNGGQPVHVVAHSMGGLTVRTAMHLHPELWDAIDRIVFIGTPHYGSPVISGYLKNHLSGFNLMALLGRYIDRQTFRSLWGVLSLLPAPVGVYPGTRDGDAPGDWSGADYPHPTADFDLHHAGDWALDLDTEEERRLQQVLDFVAKFHRDLHSWHMELPQNQRDRMAVIAGVGYRTLFRLARPSGLQRVMIWRDMVKETSRRPGDPHRDGDGRVPLASAELEFVGEARYVRGEHSRLPGIEAVWTDTFRFLRREPMMLPTTPAGALQAHLGGTGDGDRSALVAPLHLTPASDDPGYLSFDEDPTPEELDRLQDAVERGQLPALRQVRLL